MADMREYKTEIRDALDNIVNYLGLDRKLVNDATLQTYMEWFIKRCHVKTGLSELHGDLHRQEETGKP